MTWLKHVPGEKATAVIFGAGRPNGIGAAVCDYLAKTYPLWNIIGTSRQEAHSTCSSSNYSLITGIDVIQEQNYQNVINYIQPTHPLRLVFNCTGILHQDTKLPERRLADITPEWFLVNYSVHALGCALIAKHMLPVMQQMHTTQSKVVEMSEQSSDAVHGVFASLSARVGSIADNALGGWYSYRASKAAHNQIVRTLSIELNRLKRLNIVCVALHPGTVETNLSKPFQSSVRKSQLLTPDYSATQLCHVIESLKKQDNGSFLAYDRKPILW